MRMLDPDRTCGDDVAQTLSLRQRCTHALIFFGNVAGELFFMWETTNIDEDEWYPSAWDGDVETLESLVPFKEAPWMREIVTNYVMCCMITKDTSFVVSTGFLSLLRIALGVNTGGAASLSRPKRCLLIMTSLMWSRR